MPMQSKSALICGYYGHHNLGDEAMLAGMIGLLQDCASDIDIAIYTNDVEDTLKQHGPRHSRISVLDNQYPRRRRERWRQKVIHTSALIKHTHFILGGGDLLRDSPDRDIAGTWLKPLQRAIFYRRRTLILGLSVGEVWRSETKQLIKNTLNRVNYIAVRDTASKLQLQALGVKQTIYVMCDLALQVPVLTPDVTALRTGSDSPAKALQKSRPRIGISVRDIQGRVHGITAADEVNFFKNITCTIEYLIQRWDAEIHLLPLQTYPIDYRRKHRPQVDDLVSIQNVIEQLSSPKDVIVHQGFTSCEQFLELINGFELVIGTRLHALILATGLSIPTLAASYDQKVKNFMTEMGLSSQVVAANLFTPKETWPKIDEILANPTLKREQVRQCLAQYRQRDQQLKQSLKAVLTS